MEPRPPDYASLQISELARAECIDVLRANQVGRLGYEIDRRVDIEPISYALDESDRLVICMRTSEGSKAIAIRHNQWVAFQVDIVKGPLDWRSVVAHGSVYRVGSGSPAVDDMLYVRTVAALRLVAPGAFGAHDPAPFRRTLLRLHVDSLTGRSAHSSAVTP
jgi:nitroimidazol reductase NimA-like FMN-containing flavoprotein (pyridoxamine 5'-phosphate oxidase superfamily)